MMSKWADVGFFGLIIAAFGLIIFGMWAAWYSLTTFGILQTAVGAIALGLSLVFVSMALDS